MKKVRLSTASRAALISALLLVSLKPLELWAWRSAQGSWVIYIIAILAWVCLELIAAPLLAWIWFKVQPKLKEPEAGMYPKRQSKQSENNSIKI